MHFVTGLKEPENRSLSGQCSNCAIGLATGCCRRTTRGCIAQSAQRCGHGSGIGETLAGIVGQCPENGVLECRGEFGIEPPGRSLGERERRLVAGIDASCDVIKCCSRCREITAWIDAPAVPSRWCVADCTDHSAAAEWLEQLNDAEIDEAERIIRSEHDVRWLEITKHDQLWLLSMETRKTIG